MKSVTTSASVLVPGGEVANVFAYATTPAAAVEFFRGYGLVPAIRAIAFLPGHAPRVGARREVLLADGSRLEEEIVAWEPPRLHAYRVEGFRPPLSWLTSGAEGRWTFETQPSGVRITWNYVYHLRGLWAWPLAAPIVKLGMRGAMRRALERIAERQAR